MHFIDILKGALHYQGHFFYGARYKMLFDSPFFVNYSGEILIPLRWSGGI